MSRALLPLLAFLLCACRGPAERALPDGVDPRVVAMAEQCDRGDMFECNNLAASLEYGDGVTSDLTAAAGWYDVACDNGALLACVNLASLAHAGSVEGHDPVDLFGRACQGNEFAGCLELAAMYRAGDGVAADPVEASRLFGRACDASIIAGCVALGEMMRAGEGQPASEGGAIALFTDACDRNHPAGCAALAGVMLEGSGDAHRDDAIALLERACAGSELSACELGERVEVDDERRARFFRLRACEIRGEDCAD